MFTIFSSVTARTEKTVSDIGSNSGEVRLLSLLTINHLNNVCGFASYKEAVATKTQKENKLYWAPSDNWNFHSKRYVSSHSPSILASTFHVAMHLFSSRSRMTSKCGRNRNVGRDEMQPSVLKMFLAYLWSITGQTHGNMKSVCFSYLFIYLFTHGISDLNKSLFQILRKWQSTFCLVLVSKYVSKLFM